MNHIALQYLSHADQSLESNLSLILLNAVARLSLLILIQKKLTQPDWMVYGGREGSFQTSNFTISISELIISKLVFLKKSLLSWD